MGETRVCTQISWQSGNKTQRGKYYSERKHLGSGGKQTTKGGTPRRRKSYRSYFGGDLAISVFNHFSPIHLLNWEPFEAARPQPTALGAEQGQPQAGCWPASCHLCPCSSTKKHSWELSGESISFLLLSLLLFILPKNSRFFLFPGSTFFQTQICPTFLRKSLHFFPTATGCQQLYGMGPL